jgi:hypothetical protein
MTRRYTALTAVLVATLLAMSVVVEAGTIPSSSYFASNPGPPAVGGGTWPIFTFVPNNDNHAGTNGPPPNGSPNIGAPLVTFVGIGTIDFVFPVVNTLVPPATTEYFTQSLIINNTSGVTWTDFHFQLGFGSGSGFALNPGTTNAGLDFDTGTPGKDPTPTSTAFSNLSHNDYTIDWSTGTVAPASSVTFTFSFDVPDLVGTSFFTVRMFPGTTASVPEPGTLLLLLPGAALVGLGVLRRGSVAL